MGPIDWRSVPDSSDGHAAPAPRRTTSRPRRPRFALPVDHHDDRVSERIEAFLEGPTRARRAAGGPGPTVRPTQRPLRLDTRTDWETALRQEDARSARYGRPCAVVVIEVCDVPAAELDRVIAVLGTVIRHEARETDRVARVAPGRFHVLLPETTAAEADVLAHRIRLSAGALLTLRGSPRLAVSVAAPRRGEALPAVLSRAIAALGDDQEAAARSSA